MRIVGLNESRGRGCFVVVAMPLVWVTRKLRPKHADLYFTFSLERDSNINQNVDVATLTINHVNNMGRLIIAQQISPLLCLSLSVDFIPVGMKNKKIMLNMYSRHTVSAESRSPRSYGR